jgi:O-succinylbenzoate synthase
MEFRPFSVRLATQFRGVSERSGVLVRGSAADGSFAWGEYSPFADYDAERSSRWWAAAMEAARRDWPGAVRSDVPVNSIVPEVAPDEAARFAVAGGCVVAKVKVGGRGSSLADDRARVEAVASAVSALGGARARVRVDANGAWDVDQAVRSIAELDLGARAGGVEGLEYVEQPCATIEALAAVRRRVSVLIAADESVRVATDPLAVARAGAADILILKVAPLGGVRACLNLAEEAGLPIVVSSAMETSVGLAAGLALALALPDLPYACGLGTGALLAEDVVAEPLLPRDGKLSPVSMEVIV